MALLDMVNSVRGKLREERIGSIAATDLLTTEVIELLNDAACEILSEHEWSFDLRTDGLLFFPETNGFDSLASGPLASGAAVRIYSDEPSVTILTSGGTGAGEPFQAVHIFGYRYTGDRRSRLILTAPSTSLDGSNAFTVKSINSNAGIVMQLTLAQALRTAEAGGFLSASWRIFSNEHILPSTVRQVLSARSESQNIPIEFVNRDLDFDGCLQRYHAYESDTTEVMMVGGTLTTTARTVTSAGDWDGLGQGTSLGTAAAQTGTAVTIWPIPSNDLRIHYTYRYKHSDLALATDSWPNVTDDVLRVIEWRAYQMACQSGIENDPTRASLAARSVEQRLARALASDGAQPNRRRVPSEFGRGRDPNIRRRWASQTISVA